MSPDKEEEPVPEVPLPERIGFDQGNETFAQVYHELRKLAGSRMGRERAGHTLQPTALVHEAFLRLEGSEPEGGWVNQLQYLKAASEAMRRILIDHARKRNSAKRGGDQVVTELHESRIALTVPDEEIFAVHEALDRLAEVRSEAAELVKLRYFVGFSRDEAASALGLAPRTADRIWEFAKAWLAREMKRGAAD